MHGIFCVDKNNGMMFGDRRQSSDKAVVLKILDLVGEGRLLMSPYSAPLFAGAEVVADDDFLNKAQAGDFCFIENANVNAESLEDVYVFCWNRDYPADVYFEPDWNAGGYKRVQKTEFEGNSHKKITLEVYRRV